MVLGAGRPAATASSRYNTLSEAESAPSLIEAAESPEPEDQDGELEFRDAESPEQLSSPMAEGPPEVARLSTWDAGEDIYEDDFVEVSYANGIEDESVEGTLQAESPDAISPAGSKVHSSVLDEAEVETAVELYSHSATPSAHTTKMDQAGNPLPSSSETAAQGEAPAGSDAAKTESRMSQKLSTDFIGKLTNDAVMNAVSSAEEVSTIEHRRDSQQSDLDVEIEKLDEAADRAATKIQSIQRGRTARWETLPKSHTRPLKEEEEVQVAGAIGSLSWMSHTNPLDDEDEQGVANAMEGLSWMSYTKPLKGEDETEVASALESFAVLKSPRKRRPQDNGMLTYAAMVEASHAVVSTEFLRLPAEALESIYGMFPPRSKSLPKDDAATKIQSVHRGRQSRHETVQKSHTRDLKETEEREVALAMEGHMRRSQDSLVVSHMRPLEEEDEKEVNLAMEGLVRKTSRRRQSEDIDVNITRKNAAQLIVDSYANGSLQGALSEVRSARDQKKANDLNVLRNMTGQLLAEAFSTGELQAALCEWKEEKGMTLVPVRAPILSMPVEAWERLYTRFEPYPEHVSPDVEAAQLKTVDSICSSSQSVLDCNFDDLSRPWSTEVEEAALDMTSSTISEALQATKDHSPKIVPRSSCHFNPAARQTTIEPVSVSAAVVLLTQRIMQRVVHRVNVSASRRADRRAAADIFPGASFAQHYRMHILPAKEQTAFFRLLYNQHYGSREVIARVSERALRYCEGTTVPDSSSAELESMRQKLQANLVQAYQDGDLEYLLDSAGGSGPDQTVQAIWQHAPSVGTWLGRPPFQFTLQPGSGNASAKASAKVEVGWQHAPSVGTWLGRLSQKSTIQPGSSNASAKVEVGWQHAPSVGTWLERPPQKSRMQPGSSDASATVEVGWQHAPSVGTWLGRLPQKSTIQPRSSNASAKVEVGWQHAPSVGTWLGRPTWRSTMHPRISKASATHGSRDVESLLDVNHSLKSADSLRARIRAALDAGVASESLGMAVVSVSKRSKDLESLRGRLRVVLDEGFASGRIDAAIRKLFEEVAGPMSAPHRTPVLRMPAEAWEKVYVPFTTAPASSSRSLSQEQLGSVEDARKEAAREEEEEEKAARQEEAVRQESARQEAVRQEAARQEANRLREEAARLRAEAARLRQEEAARRAAAQEEAARQEAARREAERNEEAAVKIQSVGRGYVAKCRAAIQSGYKMVAIQTAFDVCDEAERHFAAIDIQSAARQGAARKKVATQRHLKASQVRAGVCKWALTVIAEAAVRNAEAAYKHVASSACASLILRAIQTAAIREARLAELRIQSRNVAAQTARTSVQAICEHVTDIVAAKPLTHRIVDKCCDTASKRESQMFSRRVVSRCCKLSEDRAARIFAHRVLLNSCRTSHDRAARIPAKILAEETTVEPKAAVDDSAMDDGDDDFGEDDGVVISKGLHGDETEWRIESQRAWVFNGESVTLTTYFKQDGNILQFEILKLASGEKLTATGSQEEFDALCREQKGTDTEKIDAAIRQLFEEVAGPMSAPHRKPVLRMPAEAWAKVYAPFTTAPASSSRSLSQEHAATRIQSIQRGRSARWEVLPKSHTRPLKEDDERQVALALEGISVTSHTHGLEEEDEQNVAMAMEGFALKTPRKVQVQELAGLGAGKQISQLQMPGEAWNSIYDLFPMAPKQSPVELPQDAVVARQWAPVLTMPAEAWEQVYTRFEPYPDDFESPPRSADWERPATSNTALEFRETREEVPEESEVRDAQTVNQEEYPMEVVERSFEFDDVMPSAPEVEALLATSEASEEIALEEQDYVEATERELPFFPTSSQVEAAPQYVSRDFTDFSDPSAGNSPIEAEEAEVPAASPERADITYYVTVYEERLAKAIMSGEFESEYSGRNTSRSRFQRPSPGYSLLQHHGREEARVASYVYGKDLTAEGTGLDVMSGVVENEEPGAGQELDTGSLRPKPPAGPNPKGRRPGPRRGKPVDPATAASDIEAWTPLRGSDSTAQLTPRAPAEPAPVESSRRGLKGLRRPRPKANPESQSRFVFTFPVANEKAPPAVSADAAGHTMLDDDTDFRATVSSIRSTADISATHRVPPLRVAAIKNSPGWSSEWVVQNSKPWPPRYHVGLPPLGKDVSAHESNDSPSQDDDTNMDTQAPRRSSAMAADSGLASANALDSARENASPGFNSNGSETNSVASPGRQSLLLAARLSRKSASQEGGLVEFIKPSDRARIHLPPVRQMRFAPLSLKSKREPSHDIEPV